MADEEKQTEEAPKPETPKKSQTPANSSLFLLKERYEINFDVPLPHLDMNGAVAYKVNDKVDAKRELFALVCSNETSPRNAILPYLKSIDNPNLMKMVEYGIIDYPKQNSRNQALIYQTPLGGKVIDFTENDIDYAANADKLKSAIISMISAAEALKGYSITHRSIRLDNLFYRDRMRHEIIVGDCAASFPAFHQPPAFETMESLMSDPEGRGSGTDQDDIYAVGVTALCLITRKELLKELSLPEVLRLKLKKGSYLTLTNEERIPNAYVNLFKGMVNDDPAQRWNYIQIYNFLEGKANSFSNPAPSERSPKALIVNGEKYYNSRNVAYALMTNQKEALEIIKSGKILEWAKSSLDNDKLISKIERLIKSEEIKEEMLVPQICVLIAPSLPIRYNNTCIFPNGAPKAIFYAQKQHKNLDDFHALFSSDIIKNWYQEQENLRAPTNAAEFRIYINRKDMGYGIDRIMYDFDEDLPCISPLIGNDFVTSAPKVLKALDNAYALKKQETPPYDRNIIAYLRCKMGKKIDGIITDLNAARDDIRISAIIRLYANMQNKYGPLQLFNLCQWLISVSKPVIKSYHNLKYQKHLEREIIQRAKSGKIIDFCDILENEEARQKDRAEYTEAAALAKSLLHEKTRIITGGDKLDEEATELALKFAGVLAVLTMISSFILNVIHWVLK